MLQRSQIIKELQKYPTVKALYQSPFYRENEGELKRILSMPELHVTDGTQPRLSQFLRVTCWNIEKGKRFDGIVAALSTHALLQHSDLILLNEVDVGMNRSGNRHIARSLAEALGMHYVFAPAHIELTKGTGEELNLRGENTAAVQGNAILSRYPLSHPRIIELPACSEFYELPEKRYGRRIAVVADLQVGGVICTVICTHLEVRDTPSCRAKQTRTILAALSAWNVTAPIVLGGDLNTNTFPRGNKRRTAQSFLRILYTKPETLKRQLTHPDRYGEPLFFLLKQYGLLFDGLNDRLPTASTSLVGIEDQRYFPSLLQKWATERLQKHRNKLDLRLDWLAAKGMRVLTKNEAADSATGIYSTAPQTIKNLRYEGEPISDHDPIIADIQIRGSGVGGRQPGNGVWEYGSVGICVYLPLPYSHTLILWPLRC